MMAVVPGFDTLLRMPDVSFSDFSPYRLSYHAETAKQLAQLTSTCERRDVTVEQASPRGPLRLPMAAQTWYARLGVQQSRLYDASNDDAARSGDEWWPSVEATKDGISEASDAARDLVLPTADREHSSATLAHGGVLVS
jgi:hypothetical protein